ncbi:type ISP restriction/modification enzyme [Streptomyces niveus]|uniref:type ISP restriction/modification enzyme n=1 Tax=Streptomyces niveus TaxID=193462 RepID=UPI0038635467
MSCDASTRTLTVGTGRIRPVAPAVRDSRIGGVRVIRKWFSFRERKPAVERQTPLNDIPPRTWPARWTRLPALFPLSGCGARPRCCRGPRGGDGCGGVWRAPRPCRTCW